MKLFWQYCDSCAQGLFITVHKLSGKWQTSLKSFQRSCAQGLCHGVSGEWRGCAEDRDCQDDLEGGSNFCANKRIAKIAYYHALHIMHRLMKWSLNYLVCSNFNQEISSWPALQQALNHSQSSPRSSFAGDGSLILSYPLILSNLIHSSRHLTILNLHPDPLCAGVGSLQPDDKVECLVTGLPPCR